MGSDAPSMTILILVQSHFKYLWDLNDAKSIKFYQRLFFHVDLIFISQIYLLDKFDHLFGVAPLIFPMSLCVCIRFLSWKSLTNAYHTPQIPVSLRQLKKYNSPLIWNNILTNFFIILKSPLNGHNKILVNKWIPRDTQ